MMKCERQARTRSSVASPPPAAGRRRRIHVRYPYSIWKGLGRIHGTALPAQTIVAPRSCTYQPIRCRRRLTTTMASRRVAVVGNGVGGGNGNVMVERTLAGHMVTKGRAVKNGAHAERDPAVYCPSMPHTHVAQRLLGSFYFPQLPTSGTTCAPRTSNADCAPKCQSRPRLCLVLTMLCIRADPSHSLLHLVCDHGSHMAC
jgi:hypothetical protein